MLLLFSILAPDYIFTVTYESNLVLELYQMVWWEPKSATVELLPGEAGAL